MNSEPVETKEPLSDEITPEQIQALIAERRNAGATSCVLVAESDQRFLVCQWPPL